MATCKICEEAIYQDDTYVKCLACSQYFHADTKNKNCAEITASEEKVIGLKSTPKLLYRCNECSTNNTINGGLTEMIDKFNNSVYILK